MHSHGLQTQLGPRLESETTSLALVEEDRARVVVVSTWQHWCMRKKGNDIKYETYTDALFNLRGGEDTYTAVAQCIFKTT